MKWHQIYSNALQFHPRKSELHLDFNHRSLGLMVLLLWMLMANYAIGSTCGQLPTKLGGDNCACNFCGLFFCISPSMTNEKEGNWSTYLYFLNTSFSLFPKLLPIWLCPSLYNSLYQIDGTNLCWKRRFCNCGVPDLEAWTNWWRNILFGYI